MADQSCPICAGPAAYALTKDGCAYQRCSVCAFLFYRAGSDAGVKPAVYDQQYWDMERREALRREQEDSFHRALELLYLSTIPVTNVLDFGCGAGVTVNLLRSRLGLNAVGVDPFGEFTPSDFLYKRTLQELRQVYPQGHFDACYSVEVFEHLDEPQQTLAELCYFLKPGGKLLVNTGTQEFLAQYDPENSYIDPLVRGHISIYALKSFAALAEPLGLRARFMGDRKYAVLLEPAEAAGSVPVPANLATLARVGDWFPPLFREYMRLVWLEAEFVERTAWALALDRELSDLKAQLVKT